MTTLVIKLLVSNEVLVDGSNSTELLNKLNIRTEAELTECLAYCSIDLLGFNPLVSHYVNEGSKTHFIGITLDTSEYKEVTGRTPSVEDTSCWSDYLEQWGNSYANNITLSTSNIQFLGRCRDWSDMSMANQVNHQLSLLLSDYSNVTKLVIDFSTSNPMFLHFYLWGLKQKLKGWNVEFIQVEKGVVILQEDYWQYWESTFQLA